MLEPDWLRSADAPALLEWLYPVRGYHSPLAQPRKLRLYYAALGRVAGRRMPAVGQALLSLIERVADEPAETRELLSSAQRIAEDLTEALDRPEKRDRCENALRELGVDVPPESAQAWSAHEWRALTWLAFLGLFAEVPPPRFVPDSYHRADLVRDIFGNPFHRLAFDPAWRTETATGLARCMYDANSFATMPILADALEDAGCHVPEILDHCRGADPHVRGCWVVDQVLDRH